MCPGEGIVNSRWKILSAGTGLPLCVVIGVVEVGMVPHPVAANVNSKVIGVAFTLLTPDLSVGT